MEHELEKLVSRYQKNASSIGNRIGGNATNMPFRCGRTSVLPYTAVTKESAKTSASMTERRRMRLISWLPRCWRN